MRLKAVVKYIILEMKNSMLIFYGIIAAILILLVFSFINLNMSDADGSASGIDMATMIFLFVVGLNSFKQNYLFLITNGVTRRAQFYGFILAILPVTAIMAAVDTIIGNILPQYINYKSMFHQIYSGLELTAGNPIGFLLNFVWSMVLYLFAIALGYFITILYYRMSKLLKIIVSIGVPALIFTILPTIDVVYNNGRALNWTKDLLTFFAGLKNGNAPLLAAIFLIVGSAVLVGLAFLLVRRAPVKE